MAIHIHLKDQSGKTILTLNDVSVEHTKVGVILYRGDYYTYHSYEAKESEFHIIFTVANVLEVQL